MHLKQFMVKKKLSQTGLAEILGVDQSTVSRWLAGTPPTWNHARAIVRYTKGKVTYDDLIGGADGVEARPAVSRKTVERGEVS